MPKTVKELHDHLMSLAKVPLPTVDRLIIGDYETTITKIATCWITTLSNLKQAVELGANTVVTHEPTFYTHWDLDEEHPEYSWYKESKGLEEGDREYRDFIDWKKNWINKEGLSILRCHDVMDRAPGVGMAVSLGGALGFTKKDIVGEGEMFKVYRVEAQTARDLSKRIAERLRPFKQRGIQFYGDPERIVKSIGVGTGCYSDPIEFMGYKADYYVAIHDSIRTWTQTIYSNDTGLPMGVIDHGASEEAGMRALCGYLNESFHECQHISGGAEGTFIE